MSNAPTIHWEGQSGRTYQYWIFPLGTHLDEKPANYMFAKETAPGFWRPCYIGQTENLNRRLRDHEKEACATRHGATHIHAHLNGPDEPARRAEEKDLILKWRPACNQHHVG